MPRKNGNTTVTEQNSYLSHLSGLPVKRTTGESKFDPTLGTDRRGKLDVKSARGSDLDTVLLAATSQRSDITELARQYQRKVGVNCRSQLAILERRRAAYQAAKHYHRPHLIESHNADAKKSISSLIAENSRDSYEATVRSVLYDVQLAPEAIDHVAMAVSEHFKNEMIAASESDDPLENLIVATQMARYEAALRKEYEEQDEHEIEWIKEDGCLWVKDPETGKAKFGPWGKERIFDTDPTFDVDRDEETGEVTKVKEKGASIPELDKEGVEEAEEKLNDIIGCNPYGPIDLPVETSGQNESGSEDSEWSKEKVEQSIAEAMDAFGNKDVTGASTEQTKGFKEVVDSEQQETTQEKLDRIRADMAIRADETRQVNPKGLYGVHDVDVITLEPSELEPLIRTKPVDLLLNETRDVRGQTYTKVGAPSSRTWRTRLGDLQVFKRPPDTLGNVVVMTDMSGSMGCGCQSCFNYESAENNTCSQHWIHEHTDPTNPIDGRFVWAFKDNAGSEAYNHISNGDGTVTCKPIDVGTYTQTNWSNGALAREVVGAISNRFKHQTKVFGFTSGGWRTGAKVAEFPTGTYPHHQGYMNFGGGTPTCSAMDYMNELLSGSMSRTAGVFIADDSPGSGGAMKQHLPITYCDGEDYRKLAESFAERGMRFGIVSVGWGKFPADIPNAVSAQIKSTDDLAGLAPLFKHLGGR